MKRSLSKRERKILKAFAEVSIPLQPDHPEMEELLNRIENHVRHLTADIQFAFHACLWLFELAAITYYAKCRRMTRMKRELRERYVRAWHETWWSPQRFVKRFLDAILFINYYALPSVEERLGFTPTFSPAQPLPAFPRENLIEAFPEKDLREEADVCIIGSGAAGAMAAMELAQKGRKVVLIEEGGYFDTSSFNQDAATMTNQLYRSGGVSVTFGWPSIIVPVGCCVGGTTVINSGTCFRTPPPILDLWQEKFGLDRWSEEALAPHFDRVEKFLQVEPACEEVQGRSGFVFARGAAAFGMKMHPLLRNAPGCCGSGVCCFGCPTNAKKSMQLNAIPAALQAGARLYTWCRAEKVVVKGRRAREVVCRFTKAAEGLSGPTLRVKARAVIVACGTLHTPILLSRSGVIDGSGQRGKHLTLHPASKVLALMEDEVKGWEGIPQGLFSDALIRQGVKLEGIFLPPAYTGPSILLTGQAHREAMEQYRRLAVFGMMLNDSARGHIFRGLRGYSIALYNVNRKDLERYRNGIIQMAKIFFVAGAKKVYLPIHTLPVLDREEGVERIEQLKLRNKDLDLIAFHPLGTCRMGVNPRRAVINQNGRHFGYDNLFIADGSIFPTALGVNPQMTIMAAALKIAAYVHERSLS